MALGDIPPWLNVSPAFFTQALEAGARAGIAVADQNQRAAALAEARFERQAQLAQREAEQAERQRQFEQSRLLDLQRLGQQAAQFQQQVAHQTAQEANQTAQESRLLDYDKARIAVENRRAALAEKEFAAPMSALDTTLVEAIDPATKQRVGLFGRSGPKTQHYIPDYVEKPLTEAQRMPGYNAMERGILAELDSIDMLAAARNPNHPKHARYGELLQQLEAVRRGRSTLMGDRALVPAPTVSTNAPANTNAIVGRFSRDADGNLKWTPSAK